MADEFFEILQNAKAIRELITETKKTTDMQIDTIDSSAQTLIEALEQLQKRYQEKLSEKGNKELESSNLSVELEALGRSLAEDETKKADLLKQVRELESELADVKKENENLSNEKAELTSTKKNLEDKITNIKNEIASSEAEVNRILKTQNSVLASLEEEVITLQKERDRIKEANAVLDFLLEESSAEIPEVDIVAAVLEKYDRKIHLDQLKDFVTIPPVSILRTVKQLDNEGIIQYNEETKYLSLK
ncbi:MAG: hypothetical protein ACFFC7_18220 [Candidatus Hermodarchaeota archaeon]